MVNSLGWKSLKKFLFMFSFQGLQTIGYLFSSEGYSGYSSTDQHHTFFSFPFNMYYLKVFADEGERQVDFGTFSAAGHCVFFIDVAVYRLIGNGIARQWCHFVQMGPRNLGAESQTSTWERPILPERCKCMCSSNNCLHWTEHQIVYMHK